MVSSTPFLLPLVRQFPQILRRKPETLEAIKKGDTVIVVAPGPTVEWASSAQRFKEQKVMG